MNRSSTPTQDNPYQETKSENCKQFSVRVLLSSKNIKNGYDFKNGVLDANEKNDCVFGIENCFTYNSKYLVVHTIKKNEKLYHLSYNDFEAQFQVLSLLKSLIYQDQLIFHHEHASSTRYCSSAASLYSQHIHTTCQGDFDEYFAIDKRFLYQEY